MMMSSSCDWLQGERKGETGHSDTPPLCDGGRGGRGQAEEGSYTLVTRKATSWRTWLDVCRQLELL